MNNLMTKFIDWRINRAQKKLTKLKLLSIKRTKQLRAVIVDLDRVEKKLDKHVVLPPGYRSRM